MSQAELLLAVQLEQARLPFEREFQFASPRRFRADFLVDPRGPWRKYLGVATPPSHIPILVEVEGGTWIAGRHSRGLGFERDCEKQALAVIRGYRYLRVTSSQVESGLALEWIRAALGLEKAA